MLPFGRGGGLVVIMLALYSNDPNSNPTKIDIFSINVRTEGK